MSEFKARSHKEAMEMAINNVDDFKKVYNFKIEKGRIEPPKIKLEKSAYDRLKAFRNDEAADMGWTMYGVFRVIIGELDREDYDANPFGNESMFEPSKDFKHWLEMHSMWGPILIMQALLYGNYELKEDESNETD